MKSLGPDLGGKLYMKVNRQLLKQFMAFRGMSLADLAGACRPKLSKSTVGHLYSGERKTCSPNTAKAIEKALDVAPGTIFMPTVSNVGGDNRRGRAA